MPHRLSPSAHTQTISAIETEIKNKIHASSNEEVWNGLRAKLRNHLGETIFCRWLKDIHGTVRADKNGVASILFLSLPTRFMRDWVEGHYGDTIRSFWRQVMPTGECEFTVGTGLESSSAGSKILATSPVTSSVFTPSASPAPKSMESSAAFGMTELDPRFTFNSFVVGASNELAHAAAKRVASTAGVSFNPLFLYGGVGLGKTHLMHAVAWHIRETQPTRHVVYMSAEKFMYQFVRALKTKDTVAFKDALRSVDVLMIDDVQFIGGKNTTQEEFFHTFDALVDRNRQIIISADKSPQELEGMDARLRSRLSGGLVADLHPTTYELRLGILQTKAAKLGTTIPEKALEFLAQKITSNVRELEGALNRLSAHASLVGRAITLDMMQEALADLLRANEKRITIDEIQKTVAQHFNIRITDMHSPRRARTVARPRQVAMYLAKQLTPRSLPEIGRKFGGRDHTTVIHAVKKIEELTAWDSSFRDDVELIRNLLQN